MNIVVIMSAIISDCSSQLMRIIKSGFLEYLFDSAIKSLNHAVGLLMSSLDQTMLNLTYLTSFIERVISCRLTFSSDTEPVRELFAVIG